MKKSKKINTRKKSTNLKKQKPSIRSLVYENFKIALNGLIQEKYYFIFSIILFLAVIVFGFIFPIFFQDKIIEILKNLANQTEGLNTLELFRFIFVNNMQSAFYGMIFGIFFAIIPLGVIIVNGYVLGFVANKTVAIAGPWVLFRLLPHGIFEIPAIIISVGIGIRLGIFLFIYKGEHKFKEFLKWITDAIRIFIFIVIPLLVIAGIIEAILISVLG